MYFRLIMDGIPARFLFMLTFSLGVSLSENWNCRQVDACTCILDNDDSVNLHLSAGADKGTPVFHFQSQAEGHEQTYTYSPCSGFSCGQPSMNDTSICKSPPNMPIGNVSSARFETVETIISLLYQFNVSGSLVTSRVQLVCSDAEQFQLVNSSSSSYNFTLHTLCACPGACRVAGIYMGVGTVLILVFLSTTTVYFGTGCVYRKALYEASGLDILPHRNFWCSLPSLIRDGYMFFISPCLGNRTEYRTYDRL